jgi:hypothetical protein
MIGQSVDYFLRDFLSELLRSAQSCSVLSAYA